MIFPFDFEVGRIKGSLAIKQFEKSSNLVSRMLARPSMNRKAWFLFISASISLALAALAQSSPTYTASEAAKHIGETAIVVDRVNGVHRSAEGNSFLNIGGKYPNQTFTAFIPSGSSNQFPNLAQYDGKTVSVSGKIVLYRGKPEIVVTSPSQIVMK
jgi:hypothetical protein